MWIASGLMSETGIAKRAVHSGVARLAKSILPAGGAPLEVVLPDGSRIGFGLPASVTLVIRDQAMLAQFADATLASLGEAYVEGRIEVQGELLEALPLANQIALAAGSSPAQRMARLLCKHSSRQDRGAIVTATTLATDFYRLWLDERMVYSCAYFKTGEESIDQAQQAKLDHICRKLRLFSGERFPRCWLAVGRTRFARRAPLWHARHRHYVVAQPVELALERVAREGLADRVEVVLLDYRELRTHFGSDAFDKIASVGMFEHVGLENLREYFASVIAVLRDRGLFLNHGITSSDLDNYPIGSGVGDFVNKYVFPHGELPHLHVATREMARAGFEILDIESLRPHYAKTLQHWSRRLEARLELATRSVDDRRLRIWRAYLAGSAHGFAQGWMSIYQLLGSRQARPGASDSPLTRDYIYR